MDLPGLISYASQNDLMFPFVLKTCLFIILSVMGALDC